MYKIAYPYIKFSMNSCITHASYAYFIILISFSASYSNEFFVTSHENLIISLTLNSMSFGLICMTIISAS